MDLFFANDNLINTAKEKLGKSIYDNTYLMCTCIMKEEVIIS